MAGPLSHIKVLDLSRVLAGPWTAQNLADLGAEVIKVERPGKGDDSRGYAPPFLKDEEGRETKEGAYFCAANRGKKSITVNLSKPEGQQLVRELAKDVDVLVENYKVGDLARYGLGYDDLAKPNPGLIYCSVTGFGQTGPYKDRPGYDFMAQGMGGLMSITGEADSVPGGGPQRVGIPIIDMTTGMYATIAICAALANRAVTGKGQWIDVALLDSCVAFLGNQAMNYFATGESPTRIGNAHPNIVPYQTFATKDGAIILACGNDNLFNKFCEAAGCAGLPKDPRFSTNAERVKHAEELDAVIGAFIAQRTQDENVAFFEQAEVTIGPIYDIRQIFEDPHFIARELLADYPDADMETFPMHHVVPRLSGTPGSIRSPAPQLGEHNYELLREAGVDADAYAKLLAAGITCAGDATTPEQE